MSHAENLQIPVSVPTSQEPAVDELFERFLEDATRRTGAAPSLRAWTDMAEAWRIAHALRACRGNRSAAARALGIGRRTLYSKMEKLGITPSFAAWPGGADRQA